ncbi:hypothetical protein DUI70_3840 [Streptomyces albus]|nr:hypothetical protein DUI70_3840 [Streptomyces albus]
MLFGGCPAGCCCALIVVPLPRLAGGAGGAGGAGRRGHVGSGLT